MFEITWSPGGDGEPWLFGTFHDDDDREHEWRRALRQYDSQSTADYFPLSRCGVVGKAAEGGVVAALFCGPSRARGTVRLRAL